MTFLLDTCTFLWLAADHPSLSSTARSVLSEPENELFLSPVTACEIAVKCGIGRLKLGMTPRDFVLTYRVAHDISELPLVERAALHVGSLPDIHRDPFDRMLICQAVEHGLAILTPDRDISRYPVRTVW